MPNENKTLLYVLTDRSGSMSGIKDDVIGGFNTFLEEQKKQPGECLMTYVQFDHEYDEVFTNVDIQQVKPLTKETFIPRGATALLDSWGRLMASAQEFICNMEEEAKPANVIMIIITDGQDNRSKEFKKHQISDMVSDREKDGWNFTFLAANQDAVAVAQNYGMTPSCALTFGADSKGVGATYGAIARSVSAVRSGQARVIEYSSEERTESLGDTLDKDK